MKIAVIARSLKTNEKRVPIHPMFLEAMNDDVLRNLWFEAGYGLQFGIEDEELTQITGNPCLNRDTLLSTSDKIIIAKPVLDDIKKMKPHAVVWGWIHSVQQHDVLQEAIDNNLTFVAWENMYHVTKRGRIHLFQTNNELAGYCAVQHALEISGIDGFYGPSRTVKIISFGSVSRGAIQSLLGQGFTDIEIFSWRPQHLIADRIHSLTYSQIYFDKNHELRVDKEGHPRLAEELSTADIIVNGILQNPNKPVMFMNTDDLKLFKKNTLIVDVSCDEGMGFPFAKPTDFDHPTFKIGPIHYYSVDHTPTLLWDSASYQISKGLLPYIYQFCFDNYSDVLNNAVDIKDGKIKNTRILEFQNRSTNYPYPYL